MVAREDAKLATADNNPGRYVAPWWLPGGHLQTTYARHLASRTRISYRRERWQTADGDFLELDWLDAPEPLSNLVVLFHGLEGCSQSHYAISLMDALRQRGWNGVVPHFRGCGAERNFLPRSYHAGDSEEIDWILRRLKRQAPARPIYVVAISLGANMLIKWLGEQEEAALSIIEKAVAVSAPLDLQAAARELDFGIKKMIYTRHFLHSMRPKVIAKIAAHDLAIDARAVRACATFRAIDNLYTAPVHGFKDADEYWSRSSSKPWLQSCRVPMLLINAQNDPFLPASALPSQDQVSPHVLLEFPESGGHVGFVSGRFPGNIGWLPRRVLEFFGAASLA
jgi:predicted alpha/beta-fold hydrolase